MATSKITTTNLFEDGTTINYSVSPYAIDAAALGELKTNVMAFNNQYTELMTDCIVSSSGAEFKKINAVEIETTEKTLIYAKNDSYAQAALNKEVTNNGNES